MGREFLFVADGITAAADLIAVDAAVVAAGRRRCVVRRRCYCRVALPAVAAGFAADVAAGVAAAVFVAAFATGMNTVPGSTLLITAIVLGARRVAAVVGHATGRREHQRRNARDVQLIYLARGPARTLHGKDRAGDAAPLVSVATSIGELALVPLKAAKPATPALESAV